MLKRQAQWATISFSSQRKVAKRACHYNKRIPYKSKIKYKKRYMYSDIDFNIRWSAYWSKSERLVQICSPYIFVHDHVHLELDFLRAVEYVSTHPNANDEIMNLYDSPFAKNAVRYVYSIIRCVYSDGHRFNDLN